MKKWFIAAAVLLFFGIGIIIGVTVAVDNDYTKLNTSEVKENTVEITDEFLDISVESGVGDVVFALSDDEKCKLNYRQRSGFDYSAEVSDNTLVIKENDKRVWYDRIDFSFSTEPVRITVCLPRKQYGNLTVCADSADVSVPDGFCFDKIVIKDNSGDVVCKASAAESVRAETDSGDINVSDITADELVLSTFSGDIEISGVKCTACSVSTDSGETEFSSVDCSNLSAESSAGDITMKSVIASGKIAVNSLYGNIEFNESDAGEISVKTDCGNVSGTLLSEKVFLTHTYSGNISVPGSVSGGKCEINTLDGNIEISVKE